nr:hypothetical protein [Tanacetum cinerariifolium]
MTVLCRLRSYACTSGGLKDEIRLVVKLKKPRRLVEAMGMARLVEEKNNLARKPFTPNCNVFNPDILGPAPTTRLVLPASKPIRRLSNNEARKRREKGLCYYCDDKYTPGHKCSKPQFCMIGDAEETENENPTNDALETQADEVQGEISFHAISGTILPQTLRLPKRIQNKDVVVLVDGGRVQNLSLVVQGCVISTDFFVLSVAACPIVLGVQWLKSLGPIEFDFNNLTIGFHIAGSHHKLQGLKASKLSALKLHELMGICDAALHLQIVSVLPQVQPELSPSPAIQKVLTDFCKVFQEPSGLPPPWFHDHSIPLLPGSKLMSSRPYRQPYFQKNEIEKQVRELLSHGLIRPSHTPFSSPMLLVKKSDVLSWPTPKSAKSVHGFLGLARYYRKFIKDFGSIAAPLHRLVGKAPFSWDSAAKTSFQALKQAPTSLVHCVFHVSSLWRFIGPLPVAVSELKEVGQPFGEATWENKWRFFKTYPAFRVEDNASLSGVDYYVALDPMHAHRVSHTEGGIESDASCQP